MLFASSSTTILAVPPDRRRLLRRGSRGRSGLRDRAVSRIGQEGVQLQRVLETHTHADHVSGHGRFALEHGVGVAITPLPSPTTTSNRWRTAPRSPWARSRSASSTRRPPARALRVHGQRPGAQRRAVADADRRLTLRRRGGPTGSRRRGGRGRARAVPQPPASARAAGRRRGAPGHVSGSLCGAGMDQAIDHDRLRAALQPGVRAPGRGRVRGGVDPRRSQAAEHGADRRAEPRPFSARPSRSGR